MLAPHLYYILKDLLRLCERPVRIFEIGPCFRKESHGRQHLSEFTMLNLVEMGLPVEPLFTAPEPVGRSGSCGWPVSTISGSWTNLPLYTGRPVDVVSGADEIELGSGAMGPHPLDHAWGITEAWVGIGFGLERLLIAADPDGNISKFGRSLAYLDGDPTEYLTVPQKVRYLR
jgi:hypothetical protein